MSAKKKQGKKWKRVVKRIITTLIILAVLAVGVLIGLDALRKEYQVTYDSYTASIGSITNSLSFSGSLSVVDSESYTASSAAKVKEVYVAPGDTVKKDQKLMRLSNGEVIKAGLDGRVNTVNVAVNDDVAAGTTLIQVADFEHLRISFRVDEYDIASVKVGDEVTVTTTATEKTYKSTIRSINYISAATGNVAYYTTTVDVQINADDGVYPGMQATVTIPQESAENVVVLKADAISFDRNNSAFVYTQAEDGSMTETPIEVGVSNGNYVEIKSGISGGDTVYVEAETETTSTLASLLSGAFGTTRVNSMGGGSRNFDPTSFGSGSSGFSDRGSSGGGFSGPPSGFGGN